MEALHLQKETAAANAESVFEDEELHDRKSHSTSAQSIDKSVCDYVRDKATYFSEQTYLATDHYHD